jgi:hypothetical protein
MKNGRRIALNRCPPFNKYSRLRDRASGVYNIIHNSYLYFPGIGMVDSNKQIPEIEKQAV